MSAVIVFLSNKNGSITLLHINVWAVTFNFLSNVWVFSFPNSCIMFVKLSRHMKSCFITKANAVKKMTILFDFFQKVKSKFFYLFNFNYFIYLIHL